MKIEELVQEQWGYAKGNSWGTLLFVPPEDPFKPRFGPFTDPLIPKRPQALSNALLVDDSTGRLVLLEAACKHIIG